MDGSTDEEEFIFTCPDCGESLEVNGAMKDALLEKGCVLCGSAVTADAFSSNSTSSPE